MHGHLEAIIDGIWEPTQDRLISINQELIRIMSLIEQLKNLNNLENEIISKSEISMKGLILNVIHNMQGVCISKNIKIEYKLEEINAYVDKDKISQVIMNIISNAIKYSSNNKYIYVTLYRDNKDVIVKIKDEGIGIPNEEIEFIFERFYRVDKSRSKEKEGIGVGLTISNMIIKDHGGSIEVESVLGEGSEFKVILPIRGRDRKSVV